MNAAMDFEQAGELKIGQVGIANLRVRTLDVARLADEMRDRLARAPKLFARAAVIVDFGGLAATPDAATARALIAALREAGVPMAVSTDHNPGTSPALSLLLMLNMACTLFRLTVAEALAGVTVHAARALGLQDTHGRIAAGRPASFVLWPLREPAELAYWFGQRPAGRVVRGGRMVEGGA